MQNNYTMEEWLDAYSKGTITIDEVKARLSEADYNLFLAEAATHKTAVDIVQRYNLLQQVRSVHEAYMAEKKPVKNNRVITLYMKRILQVAAIFIITAASGYTFIVSTTTREDLVQQLSREYYLQTNRTNETGNISAIVQEFNAKNFTAVITSFHQLNKPTSREYFLAGYAYLQTGAYSDAAGIFKKIIEKNKNTSERLYNDEAEYYLFLSYIQLKQYKDAYEYAKIISNDKYHTYYENINTWLLLKLKLLS